MKRITLSELRSHSNATGYTDDELRSHAQGNGYEVVDDTKQTPAPTPSEVNSGVTSPATQMNNLTVDSSLFKPKEAIKPPQDFAKVDPKDTSPAIPPVVGQLGSIASAFTGGLSDLPAYAISGAKSALEGKGFQQGIKDWRETTEDRDPVLQGLGTMAGALVPGLGEAALATKLGTTVAGKAVAPWVAKLLESGAGKLLTEGAGSVIPAAESALGKLGTGAARGAINSSVASAIPAGAGVVSGDSSVGEAAGDVFQNALLGGGLGLGLGGVSALMGKFKEAPQNAINANREQFKVAFPNSARSEVEFSDPGKVESILRNRVQSLPGMSEALQRGAKGTDLQDALKAGAIQAQERYGEEMGSLWDQISRAQSQTPIIPKGEIDSILQEYANKGQNHPWSPGITRAQLIDTANLARKVQGAGQKINELESLLEQYQANKPKIVNPDPIAQFKVDQALKNRSADIQNQIEELTKLKDTPVTFPTGERPTQIDWPVLRSINNLQKANEQRPLTAKDLAELSSYGISQMAKSSMLGGRAGQAALPDVGELKPGNARNILDLTRFLNKKSLNESDELANLTRAEREAAKGYATSERLKEDVFPNFMGRSEPEKVKPFEGLQHLAHRPLKSLSDIVSGPEAPPLERFLYPEKIGALPKTAGIIGKLGDPLAQALYNKGIPAFLATGIAKQRPTSSSNR